MKNKILIIDDDFDIQEAIKALLEDEGYSVQTSDKPLDLKSREPKNLPDLILLDILLSGNDGRDYARQLKSDDQLKKIPIIMLSAHPSARISATQGGADEFLEKPFDIADLLQAINRYLN
jgi:DNA-binding response OmpR family regulator